MLHQLHRMAPDQTIRVMGNKFDICDGYIQFFPTFPMEIFRPVRSFPIILPLHRMEIFEVSKFSDYIPFTQDGNFRPVRSFPIIFPLHRMEILDVSKFSDYFSIAKDGNRRLFEDFRWYSLFKGWKSPTIQSSLLIFPIKGWKSLNFTAKKITSNNSFVQFYYAHSEL